MCFVQKVKPRTTKIMPSVIIPPSYTPYPPKIKPDLRLTQDHTSFLLYLSLKPEFTNVHRSLKKISIRTSKSRKYSFHHMAVSKLLSKLHMAFDLEMSASKRTRTPQNKIITFGISKKKKNLNNSKLLCF